MLRALLLRGGALTTREASGDTLELIATLQVAPEPFLLYFLSTLYSRASDHLLVPFSAGALRASQLPLLAGADR